jgi:23S rRNA (pseudouridine1915-N3)-methyltransferase
MKLTLILTGKTNDSYLKEGLELYLKRLKNYISIDLQVIPDLKSTKNLSADQQKELEGQLILNLLKPTDAVVLLDEKGELYSSVEFSGYLQKKMMSNTKNLVFIIGGPYGFSQGVYARTKENISLSKMTFSHQMVRLIFIEQIYRAFTILKGEPYHHI